MLPYLVDDLPQRRPRGVIGEEIGGKGVLDADGFAGSVRQKSASQSLYARKMADISVSTTLK